MEGTEDTVEMQEMEVEEGMVAVAVMAPMGIILTARVLMVEMGVPVVPEEMEDVEVMVEMGEAVEPQETPVLVVIFRFKVQILDYSC